MPPPLLLSDGLRRRLRQPLPLPPYPIRGSLPEMLALGPAAHDVYARAMSLHGRAVVEATVERLRRDSSHELLTAFHLLATSATLERTTLARLGCTLLAVDDPKTRRAALSSMRDVLVLRRERRLTVFVPQVWILLPKWNRCCRPDFLIVDVRGASRPRLHDLEVDGRHHDDLADMDEERARALGLARLGFPTALVRQRGLAERILQAVDRAG